MTRRAKAFLDILSTRAAWMRRFVFVLLVVGGLWLASVSSDIGAEAQPLMQTTPTLPRIVISEFRTNGTGGTGDDFIEIFNAGDVAINIGNWLFGSSDSSGVTAVLTPVPPGIILLPGQHYLVANSGASLAVSPDGIYSSDISDDGGIGLIMPIPQTGTPTTTVVVDAVGMSAASTYKEGVVLPTVSSFGDGSYERKLGGTLGSCQDTGDNSADFTLITSADLQNLSSAPVYCVPTATPTITPTATNTFAPTIVPPMSVMINEVAWGGTAASSNDQWIELYNPTFADINLAGWHLISSDNSPDILLTGLIKKGDYYLLKIREAAIISTKGTPGPEGNDYAANQLYTGYLNPAGETLRLYSVSGNLVDTANIDGGGWNGGSGSPNYGSMERRLGFSDGPFSWITNTGAQRNGLDANGNPINGSPKRANWANIVTPTPTFIPTNTRTRTPAPPPTITRTPTPIKDFVILNEVLPHATTDLNSDGNVDVGDEYIELINMSNLNVSLQGWLLDDRDSSTGSYAFPAIMMSPGEKMAFFASQTGQYLSDGGDTVILIRPGGTPADILTYPVIDQLGQTWCRYPDGVGPWYFGCVPSPNLSNTYQPNPVPTPTPLPQAGPVDSYFSVCPLTGFNENIALAECMLPGLDIWNPANWDAPDFNTLPLYLKKENSPPVSLE